MMKQYKSMVIILVILALFFCQLVGIGSFIRHAYSFILNSSTLPGETDTAFLFYVVFFMLPSSLILVPFLGALSDQKGIFWLLLLTSFSGLVGFTILQFTSMEGAFWVSIGFFMVSINLAGSGLLYALLFKLFPPEKQLKYIVYIAIITLVAVALPINSFNVILITSLLSILSCDING